MSKSDVLRQQLDQAVPWEEAAKGITSVFTLAKQKVISDLRPPSVSARIMRQNEKDICIQCLC